MKKILLFFLMLVSVAAISQPANYLNIRSRYNLIAVKTDSGFHVPGYSTIPNYRGGVWTGSGNVGVDTVNHKFYFYSGGSWREAGATSIPISSLTAATGTNDIYNGNYTQTWRWNSLTGNGLSLQSSSTSSSNQSKLLSISRTGANSSSSVTTFSGHFTNTHTGTSSNNYGLYTQAQNASDLNIGISAVANSGTTAIAGNFVANGATNNYAIIVQPSGGRVGIGTNTPSASAILDVTSTTQGAVLPRMNTTQMNAISSPVAGLIVYNSDSTSYCYYNGSAWLKMGSGGGTPATVADTSYTTIATFTAGGGFASDTTMCTDSTLFGSFYTGQFNYTIAYIQAVIKGNAGDSIVLKLVYNDTINVDGTKVNGAGLSVNNRYKGNTFTISTNRTVPANTWLWMKPEAVITGKKPKYISVTLVGYKTYVAP